MLRLSIILMENDMYKVKRKIDIIRKILNAIESENQVTEILRGLTAHSRVDNEEYFTEKVYFDFIKFIIDQNNLPEDVCGIKIRVNKDNEIYGYEFVSIKSNILPSEKDIEIIWD